MSLRTVTGPAYHADGTTLWPNAALLFRLASSSYEAPGSVADVTTTTDGSADFSVSLNAGPSNVYQVIYPDGTWRFILVPDGPATTLAALIAGTALPDSGTTPTDAAGILAALIAAHAAIPDAHPTTFPPTRLASATAVGATSISLRNTPQPTQRGWVIVDAYTAEAEVRYVTPASYDATTVTITALAYAHASGDTVLFVSEPSFNLLWFGAVNVTGTDNTTAIQRCVDAISALGGGTMTAPNGTYDHSSTITVPNNVIIAGTNIDTTVFLNTNTAGADAFRFTAASTGEGDTSSSIVRHVILRDVLFRGNSASGRGLVINNPARISISRVRVTNHGGIGIFIDRNPNYAFNVTLDSCWINANSGWGTDVLNGYNVAFLNCNWQGNVGHLRMDGSVCYAIGGYFGGSRGTSGGAVEISGNPLSNSAGDGPASSVGGGLYNCGWENNGGIESGGTWLPGSDAHLLIGGKAPVKGFVISGCYVINPGGKQGDITCIKIRRCDGLIIGPVHLLKAAGYGVQEGAEVGGQSGRVYGIELPTEAAGAVTGLVLQDVSFAGIEPATDGSREIVNPARVPYTRLAHGRVIIDGTDTGGYTLADPDGNGGVRIYTKTTPTQTTLSAGAASGATSLTVVSSAGFTPGASVDVVLDSGSADRRTINTVPDATTITLTAGLSAVAAAGRTVLLVQPRASTTLTADAAAGANSLTVASTANMQRFDELDVVLNDNTISRVRIGNVTSSTTVSLNVQLGGAADSGKVVTVVADMPRDILRAWLSRAGLTLYNASGLTLAELFNTSLTFLDGSGNTTARISTSGTTLPGGVTDTTGTGSPEGVVTAPVGSTYRRTNGGAGTTLYVKESGSGNTGWVAK